MNTLKLDTKTKLFPTNDLWGIFFEDLNHAADGGLYPEMVQNRAFEFCEIDNSSYTPMTAWEKRGAGKIHIDAEKPINSVNTHYAVMEASDGALSLVNSGFNSGMSYELDKKYNYSVFARGTAGKITLAFEDSSGNAYASEEIAITDTWAKYEGSFISPVTDNSGRLSLTITEGTACVTMVSLMPNDTFMGHGLRRDLSERLAEMKPKFMRFPGGCLTHDGSMNKNDRDSLYRWTNTIGAVEERPPRRNNWGYNQTAGLGFYEYFVFCEDIGAKAIPVVSGGWNPHSHSGVELSEIGEFVDETLALIEFANGSTDSEWGSIRAKMGHEEPFNLEYIAIGNEEVADGFFDRYPYFHKAIRAKYPDIKIIGTSGPWADGYDFEYGWNDARKHGTDIVDEHYYMHTDWFFRNMDRYKSYDRKDPKVFIGEFASWGNKYRNALTEACYMTAVENNADVVSLACYAPLFANADYVNWEPDMIWFDNHRSYVTPNYHVQKMFMTNQPEYVIKTEEESDLEPISLGLSAASGRAGVSLARTAAEFYDVTIDGEAQTEIYAANRAEWESSGGKFAFNDKTTQPSSIFFPKSSDNAKIRMKAKKLSGVEGFRIIFGAKNSSDYYFWEIGGWTNSVSAICKMNGPKSATVTVGGHVTVEADHEYDICIEVIGNRYICTLDGEVMHDFCEKAGEIKPIYYTAGITGDTAILKAANYRDSDYTAEIVLDKEVSTVKITELFAEDLDAENSFESPANIAPTEKSMTVTGNSFKYTFKKQSVTVLEIN